GPSFRVLIGLSPWFVLIVTVTSLVSARTQVHSGQLSSNAAEIEATDPLMSAGSPVNLPTRMLASFKGSMPIARAMAWPLGSLIRQPRIKLRCARDVNLPPLREKGGANGGFGRLPSGSTKEVSIL